MFLLVDDLCGCLHLAVFVVFYIAVFLHTLPGWTPGNLYSSHYVEHAKLLHWNGDYKPWFGAAQFSELWDKYYVADPLGQFEPVRRTKRKHS